MMTAESKFGDGDFAGAGGGSARPRGDLNLFDPPSGEGFEVEHCRCGSVHKKAHLGGAYADFDHREAVAAFDGDFVRPGSRLSEKRGRKKRMRHRKEAHTEDSSMHLTILRTAKTEKYLSDPYLRLTFNWKVYGICDEALGVSLMV